MKASKRYLLAQRMDMYGVSRSDEISFGRPVVKGTGIPTDILLGRWSGGDSFRSLAADYGISPRQVENAVRFAVLYPKSDLPSFWKEANL